MQDYELFLPKVRERAVPSRWRAARRDHAGPRVLSFLTVLSFRHLVQNHDPAETRKCRLLQKHIFSPRLGSWAFSGLAGAPC